MSVPLHRIPLRARKYAQTRLNLRNAVAERLEQRSLDEISVKELCEAAVISEATFFNYFPRKADLVNYLIQLWTLELNWHGRQEAGRGAGVAIIDRVFERAAEQIQARPGLMGEIIAHQARLRERPQLKELTPAERLLAFPGLTDIEEIPDHGIEGILVASLQEAVHLGQLPPNTHLNTVLVALVSIFFGVPLALRAANPKGVGAMYRQELAVLWAGVRAVSERPGR